MPPKRKSIKKKAAPVEDVPAGDGIPAGHTEDTILDKDITQVDLLVDINEEFFARSNKIVEALMTLDRKYEALNLQKSIALIYQYQQKCRKLAEENNEFKLEADNAEHKIKASLELTQNAQECMKHFKEELTQAWTIVDAAVERDQASQELLQKIQLHNEGKRGYDAEDDTKEFGALAPYKKMILRERDRLSAEVTELERRLQMNRYYSEALEQMNNSKFEHVDKLEKKLDDLRSEKSALERKLKNLTASMEETQAMLVEVQKRLINAQHDSRVYKIKFNEKSDAYEALKAQNTTMTAEHEGRRRVVEKLETRVAQLTKELDDREEEIRAMKVEDSAKHKTILALEKKQKFYVDQKRNLNRRVGEMTRKVLNLNAVVGQYQHELTGVQKELKSQMKNYAELSEIKDSYVRQRDNLSSEITRLDGQLGVLKHSESLKKNLIEDQKGTINNLNSKMDQMAKEQEKERKEYRELAEERGALENRLEYYKEQLILKNERVMNLRQKLAGLQQKVFNYKKQFDETLTKAWELEHQISTLSQEKDKMLKQVMIYQHTMHQLSNEVVLNQKFIGSLKMRINTTEGEKRQLKGEFDRQAKMLDFARSELKALKMHNAVLQKTLDDDYKKFQDLNLRLEDASKQKNLMGNMLARRNDEILLLKEKLHIQETAIALGTKSYNQRVEDIRLLKNEISDLQHKSSLLERAIRNTADMRICVVRTNRALLSEQVKARALEDDMKSVANIHRWRILKGEDPTREELIQKLNAMKRIYLKQETEKKNLKQKISTLETTVSELKNAVQKMPTRKKLVKTEYENRKLTKRCKALAAEHEVDRITILQNQALYCELKNLLNAAQQRIVESFHDQYGGATIEEIEPTSETKPDKGSEELITV